MRQSTWFDLAAGLAAREYGMDLAADPRADILERARAIATTIARSRMSREVSADDVYRQLNAEGYSETDLGPAAGSIFRGPAWEFTGVWRRSERVSNHGRMIRVWQLRGERQP